MYPTSWFFLFEIKKKSQQNFLKKLKQNGAPQTEGDFFHIIKTSKSALVSAFELFIWVRKTKGALCIGIRTHEDKSYTEKHSLCSFTYFKQERHSSFVLMQHLNKLFFQVSILNQCLLQNSISCLLKTNTRRLVSDILELKNDIFFGQDLFYTDCQFDQHL